MKPEDFLTYYSNLSTVELLKIIEQKENYQPDAIEAANKILSERGYSNDELNAAREEINLLVNKKIERQEKIDKKINKVNYFVDEHFGLKERSPEKILNLFCAGLLIYTLVSSILNIKFLASLFYYQSFKGYFIAILIYALQVLIIYLLYKRSNWGWACIVISHIFLVTQNVQLFIDSFSYTYSFLFKPINPYSEAVVFCIHLGIIVFLNSKKIIKQFAITKNNRIAIIIISLILSPIILLFLKAL